MRTKAETEHANMIGQYLKESRGFNLRSYGLLDSVIRRYSVGRGVTTNPLKNGGIEYPEPEDFVKPVWNYAGRVVKRAWKNSSKNNFENVYYNTSTSIGMTMLAAWMIGGPTGAAAMATEIAAAGISGAVIGLSAELFSASLVELGVSEFWANLVANTIPVYGSARALNGAMGWLATRPQK